ncbi:hypothetical protein LXA43DRAFT_1068560 [Ganoderma leucocontextum]|nr:hypothetical protein LXA43DRAFT_1068560 [Ganoderma leucocontextum]
MNSGLVGTVGTSPLPIRLEFLLSEAYWDYNGSELVNFGLHDVPIPAFAANILSDIVVGWTCLQSIDVPSVAFSGNALRHLATLPSLQALESRIDLDGTTPDDFVGDTDVSLIFPSLRRLAIRTTRLETCATFIRLVQSGHLENIALQADEHATADCIEDVCNALAAHPSAGIVEELMIKPGCIAHDPEWQDMEGPASFIPQYVHVPMRQSAITPILSLRSLFCLFLLGPCFSAIDNDTVAAIAEKLPCLGHATLCLDAAYSSVTLAGLMSLGRCSVLRSLEIALADVDEANVATAFTLKPRRPHPDIVEYVDRNGNIDFDRLSALQADAPRDGLSPLRTLNVGRARLAASCVDGTAGLLTGWFPELRSIHVAFDPTLAYSEVREAVVGAAGFDSEVEARGTRYVWRSVLEGMAPFLRVRQQEQSWVTWHRVNEASGRALEET